ncbi:MAG: YebC/PmpR family DNA-binding regulatory protein, partial [Candidatus Promineifilaceae bacterium]
DTNVTLRTLVQKAKGSNMPADNIERAIKKGIGDVDGVSYEEITYEGYAAGGVAMVVNVLTDNKNRAASEIRHIFSKHNSSFATLGSVTRNFERKGQILVDASTTDEDTLMDLVIEAGADDMKNEDDQFEILTDPSAFGEVSLALDKANISTVSADVTLLPTVSVPVDDASVASSVLRFVNDLEDNDDVQAVYINMDMSDDVLTAMAEED